MSVIKTQLAPDSQLHAYVNDGDFLDCYSVRVNRNASSITGPITEPMTEIAQRVFIGQPAWARALMAIRDLSVSPFGLKTTAALPTNLDIGAPIQVGDPINFLCVRSISDDEIILGEDDDHLDFKISVNRKTDTPREGETGCQISLATWVRTHNRLGRIYLATITPLHILIVKASLKRLAQHYAN